MWWKLLAVPFVLVVVAMLVVALRTDPRWFYAAAGVLVLAMFCGAFALRGRRR